MFSGLEEKFILLCFGFRDVKCMLELDFAFRIHALSLCEEFLICASATECQTIQLNFNPYICSVSCIDEKESAQSEEFSTCSSVVTDRLNASVNNNSGSNNSSLVRHITATDAVRSVNGADIERSGNANGHGRSLALNHQVQFQQEFTCTDLGLSKTSNRCDELFAGPVKGSQAPCPVSVEFEGTSHFFAFVSAFVVHPWNHWLCVRSQDIKTNCHIYLSNHFLVGSFGVIVSCIYTCRTGLVFIFRFIGHGLQDNDYIPAYESDLEHCIIQMPELHCEC